MADVKQITEEYDKDGRPFLRIVTAKFKNPFLVRKDNTGFALFEVAIDGSGKVPASLSGKYSSLVNGRKAVEDYLKVAKKSVAKRRQDVGDDYEKRKASKEAKQEEK